MILTIPYLLPSGSILRIYSIGSRNSSSVGRNVGASGMPNSLFFFGSSLGKFGWPRRSTVDRSSGSARRALSGIAWLLPDGGPFSVPGAVIGIGLVLVTDAVGVVDGPGTGLGRMVVMVAAVPVTGGTTIFATGECEGADRRISSTQDHALCHCSRSTQRLLPALHRAADIGQRRAICGSRMRLSSMDPEWIVRQRARTGIIVPVVGRLMSESVMRVVCKCLTSYIQSCGAACKKVNQERADGGARKPQTLSVALRRFKRIYTRTLAGTTQEVL